VGVQDATRVSAHNANRVGAHDARYPAMSVVYTQHSLQDSKLASCAKIHPDEQWCC
jgi:hypothetical protein